MFKKYKQLIIGVVLGAFSFNGVPVMALSGLRSISVKYDNIRMTLNGKEVKADAEPFIYEGSTYVPLRFVSEVLGASVNWHSNLKTIDISNQSSSGVKQPSTQKPIGQIENVTELKKPKIGAPGIYNGTGGHSALYDFVKFGFKVNSVGGVSVDWVGQNLTGKTINYYTANIAIYNPVGDPAYDTIKGTNKVTLKFVGPVEPNSIMTLGELGYYSNTCHKVVIESFDIIYSDGTAETIPYGHSTTLRVRN